MEPEADVVYAGFLRRWAAIFLDQLILTSALFMVSLFMVMLNTASDSSSMAYFELSPLLVLALVGVKALSPWLVQTHLYDSASALYFVGACAYYSLFESSASQATVGKMALGIKVTDEHGSRLSLPHALGRWFAAALSYLTLYIGFLVAAFTARKQALHDLVAKTLVVDKWAYTDTPERQQRSLHGCLIAFLVVMVILVGVAVLGILASIAILA